MLNTFNLSDGTKIELLENGCIITYANGKRIECDTYGNEVVHEPKGAPEWLKYFDFMETTERNIVKEWYLKQKPQTLNQGKFLKIIANSLEQIDYNYCIANIEPSNGSKGKLEYAEKENVCVELNCIQWNNACNGFAPEYGSSLATIYELFIWYAYRIAKGYWTIEYVCDYEIPDSFHEFEQSGIRIIGGARDGIGNTNKIVKNGKKYALCGRNFFKSEIEFRPGAFLYFKNPYKIMEFSVGVTVLRNL